MRLPRKGFKRVSFERRRLAWGRFRRASHRRPCSTGPRPTCEILLDLHSEPSPQHTDFQSRRGSERQNIKREDGEDSNLGAPIEDRNDRDTVGIKQDATNTNEARNNSNLDTEAQTFDCQRDLEPTRSRE